MFDWDKCNLDQIFVFEDSAIDHILNISIAGYRNLFQAQESISADILFLCIRYAHYYNSNEQMNMFFERAIKNIGLLVKVKVNKSNV